MREKRSAVLRLARTLAEPAPASSPLTRETAEHDHTYTWDDL